jgi:hypothetical protein
VIATNPMEIVKIRMQMQALLPVEQRQGTMEVVRSLGLKGMYVNTSIFPIDTFATIPSHRTPPATLP